MVGDVCISMVMKLAGHGSGDACFQWMSPEVLKAEEFSEKSDVVRLTITGRLQVMMYFAWGKSEALTNCNC